MCSVKMIHSHGILSNVTVCYTLVMIADVRFLFFHLLACRVFIVMMCLLISIGLVVRLGELFIFIGSLRCFIGVLSKLVMVRRIGF
jgi:hypothetical protein